MFSRNLLQKSMITDVRIMTDDSKQINHLTHRYPHCIVWTPIPLISWFLPFVGHMGIGTSTGVIRDFSCNYCVSEDSMAFGWPVSFWYLDLANIEGGAHNWDSAIVDATDVYKNKVHNLLCDNCHSYVALALNRMKHDRCSNWNMVKLAVCLLIRGKYVSFGGFLKQWLPFAIIFALISTFLLFGHRI